ncbi:helix-turn-helix domain-containing protein [Pseudonocardia hydrocarbonoxydans]|uniref:HTH cro/C1-type domain-containing protein n=1 Tax=Pseudonocardia hydrocarbonoxydans TaxID=76726 RepID=A0A4Y3WSN5_9PSEU|nr:helix-turn-helix transcriptional regulator [Pseudonocardia hydrocarbonoxydans]GEC21863.1 hypothetical protein PHY01_41460 [Pseudonocardia hydrocarbonoxydans]
MYHGPGSTEKISAAIRSSGMTQREIARAVGLSEGSISHYVNGWRLPSAGNLYRLAGVLGVDVRSLT